MAKHERKEHSCPQLAITEFMLNKSRKQSSNTNGEMFLALQNKLIGHKILKYDVLSITNHNMMFLPTAHSKNLNIKHSLA